MFLFTVYKKESLRTRKNYPYSRSNIRRNYLTDSPLCACGSIEETYHYLLICNRFSNLRDLLNTVSMICRPTIDVFFFGNDDFSTEHNKNTFLAVQTFVLKTKRFQVN